MDTEFPILSEQDEKQMFDEEMPPELGILPLKNTVLYPGVVIPITVGRDKSIELVRKYRPVIDAAQHLRPSAALSWRPSRRWALAMSGVFAVALVQVYRLEDLTEFIYFNF